MTGDAVKKYYAFAGMTIGMDNGSGMKYFLTDHLGSVVAITDAGGALISQQRYLPFGGVRTDVASPNAPATDFGYTGQRNLDAEGNADIGLMDYHARFYDDALGRFIQPDSVVPNAADPQSFNHYSYVLNEPTRLIDPSGNIGIAPPPPMGCDDGYLGTCKAKAAGQNYQKHHNNNNDDEEPSSSGNGNNPPITLASITSDTLSWWVNGYQQGWTNFGNAWSIYTNPNSSVLQRMGAGLYMEAWGGAHIVGAVGGILFVREGIILIGAQLATQNPDSPWTMLGRFADATDNYMAQANSVEPKATYFDLGNSYKYLDLIGLAKPMNQQFILNQISQEKDFVVYGTEEAETNLQMEINMITTSGLYTEYGDVANDLYSNFFQYDH